MKKFKLLNVLLILSVIFAMPVAYAHEVATDNSAISIENINNNIYSGSKIIVNSSVGEHTLYYQYVKMTDEEYKNYKVAFDAAKKYKEEENPGASASDDEKKAYEEELAEYLKSIEEILPSYNDSNWVESSDNTAKLDLSKVPENKLGFQPYVLWIKAEPKDSSKSTAYNDFVVMAKHQAATDESDEENAKTGDNIVFLGIGAILVAGVMIISYKKAKA